MPRKQPDLVAYVGSDRNRIEELDGWPADRECWEGGCIPQALAEPPDAVRLDLFELAARMAAGGVWHSNAIQAGLACILSPQGIPQAVDDAVETVESGD